MEGGEKEMVELGSGLGKNTLVNAFDLASPAIHCCAQFSDDFVEYTF